MTSSLYSMVMVQIERQVLWVDGNVMVPHQGDDVGLAANPFHSAPLTPAMNAANTQ